MNPSEAGRELARAVTIIRSTGRKVALWRSALVAIPVLVICSSFLWIPEDWLARRGSPLPMSVAMAALMGVGALGFVMGASLRAWQLRRKAQEVETARGLARGELLGAIELGETGDSAGLAQLQRMRVAAALDGRRGRELLPLTHRRLRSVRRLVLPGAGVAVVLIAAGLARDPESATRSAALVSRPWAVTFPPPPPPLAVSPPGGEVPRGASFEIVITARNRSEVTLGLLRPGTPAARRRLQVSGDVAAGRIDPVDETIRYWAEDERGEVSDTFTVVPLDPLTITDLRLDLQYPSYLRRAPELLSGSVTDVRVPHGTRIGVTARTNQPVYRMGLARETGAGGDTLELEMTVDMARGQIVATEDELLSWWLVPADSVPGIVLPPAIALSVDRDERPTVSISYPGEDRLLGIDRSLALVIEARDDHGLREIDLVWWRETATESADSTVRERLAVGQDARRLTVRPVVDLEAAGFLPGDEIVYFATALDARPGVSASVSDTFRARLSNLDELGEEVAQRTLNLVEEAGSLREQAGDLSDAARDAERRAVQRDAQAGRTEREADRAGFRATGEARDLAAEGRAVEEQLAGMEEELQELRAGLESSPFADPDLTRRLGELEELYREILESGLRDRIEALEEALRGLDRDAVRKAVSDFARHAQDVQERLDQALGLMERVAIEQSLEGARQTAEDLADRQDRASRSDPAGEAWAAAQEELAAESAALAERAEDLADRLDSQQAAEAAEMTREAARKARSAASRTRSTGRDVPGGQHAERAASAREASLAATDLERAERDLAAAAESLSGDWRGEAMRIVGQAADETLELAREQEGIVQRLRAGVPPQDLAADQAAVREGLDNVSQSLGEAGRQTALLDRRAGPAAARAGSEMDAAGQSMSGGAVRRNEAVQQGESAMEALSDLAASLLASGSAMAETSSATGMEEALDRLAGMGRRQAGVNSESGELFMLLRDGGAGEVQLRDLAARQAEISRSLSELATRPAARGLAGRPEVLAAEADEIARRLMAGTLDRETLVRQEQLFRRLLDAGRSLEQDEKDTNRREATTARPRVALQPDDDALILEGPRYPYPSAERMESLSVSQRRLVYEYFDRLNGGTVEEGQ